MRLKKYQFAETSYVLRALLICGIKYFSANVIKFAMFTIIAANDIILNYQELF
jgi:hypothetical protein